MPLKELLEKYHYSFTADGKLIFFDNNGVVVVIFYPDGTAKWFQSGAADGKYGRRKMLKDYLQQQQDMI